MAYVKQPGATRRCDGCGAVNKVEGRAHSLHIMYCRKYKLRMEAQRSERLKNGVAKHRTGIVGGLTMECPHCHEHKDTRGMKWHAPFCRSNPNRPKTKKERGVPQLRLSKPKRKVTIEMVAARSGVVQPRGNGGRGLGFIVEIVERLKDLHDEAMSIESMSRDLVKELKSIIEGV